VRLAFLILTISAAVLGYEVALMRALSVARWHHFAYLVVSVALLGFGASGTVLSLWGKRLLAHFDRSMAWLATAFALAIPASFSLAQGVPFDVFQLAWDWRQSLYLLEYCLLLFVPFLLGATCIGLALVREAGGVHKLYFWNLIGSGIGACGVVGLMFVLPPGKLPLGVFVVAAFGALVFAARRWWMAPAAAAMALALVYYSVVAPLELSISEHKGLRGMLDRGARIVEERTGPLGTVHVLEGSSIHLVAGLSLAYEGEEWEQRALVVDADSASAIHRLASPEQARAFDFTAGALPYHLLSRPRTLIIGAGGGGDVILARYHHAERVTALEMNPAVVALMKGKGSQAEFSGRLYEQPGVELVAAEARGYLAATERRYGLIQLPLVESFAAAAAGVYALNEGYLYTVEAVESYLGRLAEGGILCITRWLKPPPSDSIRIFATVTEALRRRGVQHVASHVVFIRGWSTATILARTTPFTADDRAAVRRFCAERRFDLVWLEGMEPAEANRYHVLSPEDAYAAAARQLVSPERDAFLRAYPFDVTPTTDDRPYHALSQRWRGIRYLRSTMGDRWVHYAEWGYIVLVATLLLLVVQGAVLILVPLLFLGRTAEHRGGRLATCVYFACLGVAYMFLEIAMMQKLVLFLASPIYAAAVILTSFMVFSGLGSLAAGRLLDGERRAATFGIAGILAVGLLLWLGMDPLLACLARFPFWVRVVGAAACAGSLAFFMGMPFPSGLRRVASQVPELAPWAWGVNGCASVVGATLAMVLAVSYGFRVVLLAAFLLYALAGLILPRIAARRALSALGLPGGGPPAS
jgi:spermidine synthase